MVQDPPALALKPIETLHNGVRYRSRLEARWAIFFETLGAKFFFEHEGFELPSGRYVPDFWFPEMRTFVEIKAEGMDSAYDEQRRAELASASGCDVILFDGEPGYWGDDPYQCVPPHEQINCRFPDPQKTQEELEADRTAYDEYWKREKDRWSAYNTSDLPSPFLSVGGWQPPEPNQKADGLYLPCICPACRCFGIQFDGRGWRACRNKCRERETPITVLDAENTGHEDKGYTYNCSIVVAAYKKANNARFWEAR